MVTVLFIVFLAVFVATAVITLLGLIGKVTIKEGYLKGLYVALILEVVGVMIGVAKEANFIGDPYGDLMARLPQEVKGETSDEVIDKITALTSRPVQCVDCSVGLSEYIKQFPDSTQRSTLDDSFVALHEYIGTLADEKQVIASFVHRLPFDIQGDSAEITIENVEKLSKSNRSLKSEMVAYKDKFRTSSLNLEQCKDQLENCAKPADTGLPSKFMVLRDDLRKYGSVNFLWGKEEKKNVAFRVLEVLGELGYYNLQAEPNPDAAHKAVKEYQERKNIQPANGRFGRKTYLQLFNDFITLE